MPQIRPMMRHVHGWLAFSAVLLVLAIGFPLTSAAGVLLLPILPRRTGKRLGRALIRRGFRFLLWLLRITGLCRLDVRGLAPLGEARGLVVAPNHPTLLDVVLIVAHLPNAVCITKAGLWDNPLTCGTARLAGYIRNDSPLPLVRRAVAELQEGANLLIFPEGTRTPPDAGLLGPFRPGFALMARAAGVPVQPVLIEAATPYLRKGWPVWRKPSLPLAFGARLGLRLPVTGQAEAFAIELHDRMLRDLAR